MSINVQAITFSYPEAAKPVLQDFSCNFFSGEIVAITGKNGCGKTTLSKLLVGILKPQQGSILIDDINIAGKSLYTIGQKIGYIWQNPAQQLFCPTAEEEIAFGLTLQGFPEAEIRSQTENLLAAFHLTEQKHNSPLKLSLGEKQRLALATVFTRTLPYLVLDEPTGGLDIRSRRELGLLLQNLAQNNNCGIIFISHERDFIRRWANRELIL